MRNQTQPTDGSKRHAQHRFGRIRHQRRHHGMGGSDRANVCSHAVDILLFASISREARAAVPIELRLSTDSIGEHILPQGELAFAIFVWVHVRVPRWRVLPTVHFCCGWIVFQQAAELASGIRWTNSHYHTEWRQCVWGIHGIAMEGVEGLLRQLGLLPVSNAAAHGRLQAHQQQHQIHVLQLTRALQGIRPTSAWHRLRRHDGSAPPFHRGNV
mmetsp:Transcript_8147/g.23416  ORF Transcript_8147/g.23416 Transcript_8147/m.23416 type:complete len:214 (+) Transcript_8147:905-1546(+)